MPSNQLSVSGLSAISEHRRLFSFGKRRQLPSKQKGNKKIKNQSCTLKFVCLSSTKAEIPPSSVKERTELCNAGLGDSSIKLELNDDRTYLYEKVMECYPKLFDAGGFEFLLFQRGGGEDGGIHVISPPHTSSHLKDICSQAKIYIRPLQKDICLKDDIQNLEQDLQVIIEMGFRWRSD